MDAIFACESSVIAALRTMATFQETYKVEEIDRVLFVTGKSRFPAPYSNAAFPTGAVDAGVLLDRSIAKFADRRHFVWGRDGFGEELERVATARGFISFGTMPAMAIEARVPEKKRDGIRVARAADEAGFADFVAVSQEAYVETGLPKEIAASLLARADRALSSSDIFVAYADETPLAAAFSITIGDIGGLYWVGTVPQARKRGAADAVTRAATNASFDRGASIVTLQASALGEPVYLRIGYREVCRYLRALSGAPAKATA
jgi:ribosomal protein S18 acetylase RimI-like enzyme